MSAASEPEKYSIDEMMERLKNRPAEAPIEDGELVTRSDGTQAIRVRKRKRRSHQPHKEELRHQRRNRMIQISGALILILLAGFAAGAAIVFSNSAPFREALLRKISENSGATAQLSQFRVNPTHANAGGLILTWPEGNTLAELSVRGLKASIHPTSFLGKSMVGEEVTCAEGQLQLRVADPDNPQRTNPGFTGPSSIRFKRYAIPRLNVIVGDPATPILRMFQSEGSFHPSSAIDRPQLLLTRGDIQIPNWPKLRLDRSHIEFRGPETDVISMRLRHESDNRGVFELSGTVSPYLRDRPSTLAVYLESFLLSGLVGPELGRLFSGPDPENPVSGRIDSVSSTKSNYLSFTPVADPDAKLAITFRAAPTSNFELTGFPFLATLALLLDDQWFAHPMFEANATGVLRREDGAVAFSELNLESKGRMAVRGGFSMAANRSLSGALEVGIAEPMVKTSANRRLDAMLGPTAEGFRWVTIKIGGSASQPADNFRELFEASTVGGSPTARDGIPTFEELVAPE